MQKKILIIKLDAMGDVLRTTSILRGLKDKHKDCNITWFTKPESVPLITNHPYIDKVVSYSKINIKNLENKIFDTVINLDEDLEACSIASRLKGEKIGFYLDGSDKIVPTASAQKVYEMSALGKRPRNDILKKANKKTYQELIAEIVGIKKENNELIFRLNKKQKDYAEHFSRQFNINPKKELVIGLNTGSGKKWPSKNWGIKNTAELAERIHKELKARIILFGGPNEIERNNQIIALSKVPIINAGCGNNLIEFPALVSLCDIFVTTDTLGLHLAIALKRKIIALFGPTSSSEIEMYGLGEKITGKKCLCCYNPQCKSMETISVNQVLKKIKDLNKKQEISIIITSYKEPGTDLAIRSFIEQDIKTKNEILVVCPDIETKRIVEKYSKKHPEIKHIQDPGKGKSYALNQVLKKAKGDILILTDGDVNVGKNSVNEIIKKFKDPLIGCVSGRPISKNPKNKMIGYWSHLLFDAGAHNIRKENSKKGFLECTGYLFAFRNKVINKIPLDVAEDTVIPYMFWEKGYRIEYAEKALVFVKNPQTFRDWMKQKKRTAKAHETLDKYVDIRTTPRIKTLKNEIKKGLIWALGYPKNSKEFVWTITLFLARGFMWGTVLWDTTISKKHYNDVWERVESTK